MLKHLVSSAMALLAATALAKAADYPATGRITHIDASSRTVLVNHVRIGVAPSLDLAGFHLAEKVTVSGPAGAATLAPSGKVMAAAATGRITYLDPASRTVMVNHSRIAIGPAVDLIGFHLAEKVTIGGMPGAYSMAPFDIAQASTQVAPTVTGRITHLDPASRTVLVNHARIAIAPSVDLGSFHLAQKVTIAGPTGAQTMTTAARMTAMMPTGRVTYVNAANGMVLIDNVIWPTLAAMDLSHLSIGAPFTLN